MKKILAFPLVRLFAIVIPFVAALLAIERAADKRHGQETSVLITVVAIAILLLLVAGIERATTGRRLVAIGFDPRRIVRDTAFGVALGAGLFTTVILVLVLGGHYRVTAVHLTSSLWFAALFVAIGAILEELLFRSVVFRIIDELAGLWVALGISAAFFGGAHALNHGATWVSSLAIAVEAGVLLGVGYAITKNVWFPIGVHFAWNFCEGSIYGTLVSGGAPLNSLFSATLTGPAWLTGGAFGPEAGAPAIAAGAIASVALLAFAQRSTVMRAKA